MKKVSVLCISLAIILFVMPTNSCKEKESDPNVAPGKPTLTSPTNSATGIAVDAVLLWQPATDPDGDAVTYDVYFGTETIPTKKVSSNQAGTTYSPSLDSNTTYYWKVVAKDPEGATSESAVRNFSTTRGSEIIFTKSCQTLGNTRSQGASIADIDMDNDLDILFSNYIGTCPLWLNNGDGSFTISNQVFNVQEAHDVALADFNGDSLPDALFICHISPVKLYINDGSGNFTESSQYLGSAAGNPQFIDVADIDDDGDNDFLIYYSDAENRLWKNDGAANFTMINNDIGGSDAKGFELADFNGDKIPDLFINMRELPNQVLMNDGTGNFIDYGCRLDLGGDATDCIDFDKDGDTDLIISGSGGTTVWLNQNNGESFVSGPTVNESALHLKILDADHDGNYDLITTNYSSGNKFWLNNGSGSFSSLGQVFGSQQVLSLVCGDIDGDEDIDVIFGQLEGTGDNSIYINESVIN